MLTKTELVSRLKRHITMGDKEWPGQTVMLEILLKFFDKETVPEYEDGGLLKNLPKYTVTAFKMTNICPLNLTQVTFHPISYRITTVRKLGILLEEVTGRAKCREELESYCLAQDKVIEQSFDIFVKKVYCRGLAELANRYKNDTLEGVFGTTTLIVRPSGRNRVIIFWRKPYYYRGETSIVVFNREKLIRQPIRFVLKEVIANNFYKAVEMIEEVIIRWPINPEDQQMSFEIIKPPFH